MCCIKPNWRVMMAALFLSAMADVSSESSIAQAETFTTLHSFDEDNESSPLMGPLVTDGSALYGTSIGGRVYSIGLDGSGYRVLHSLSEVEGHTLDGVVLNGSTLYGTAETGGPVGEGTIFRLNTDGTGFTVLHAFDAALDSSPLWLPCGVPIIDGSTLYCTTNPSLNMGVVFKMNTDGSDFATLCELPGSYNGSTYPGTYGSLIRDNSTLYGTTGYRNVHGGNTVYKVGTDGTGYTVLHTFPTNYEEGLDGQLTLVGSTLYGTARYGSTGDGLVYRVNTNGNGFTVLHDFTGVDGQSPECGVALADNMLYGITHHGGASGLGAIYRMDLNGSNFEVVHSFAGGPSDGEVPWAALTVVGSTIYGTTAGGGTFNRGTIFALTIPEPSTFVLLGIGALGLLAYARRRRLRG